MNIGIEEKTVQGVVFFFKGSPYSHTNQLKRIEKELVRFGHGSLNINATPCYFVIASEPFECEQLKRLEALLNAKQTKLIIPKGDALVVPRRGTISPWSSKATQLAKITGFENIERVEYSTQYSFLDHKLPPRSEGFALLYDRMVQSIWFDESSANSWFNMGSSSHAKRIEVLQNGKANLQALNTSMGLALNDAEIDYLLEIFARLKRNPTDAEIMMFAQVNSEHCRHKVFNSKWEIDGDQSKHSLFSMIRNTHTCNSDGVIVAYDDNAAVIEGGLSSQWRVSDGLYQYKDALIHNQIKVETHNHPTAISPWPGAATGAGGEIRDEAATGRGSTPKAGLVGFSVSSLNIPNAEKSWEYNFGKPTHTASAFEIMMQAPVGAARYNNEFGRPCICGYFRAWQAKVKNAEDEISYLGYHKPIMLAGGLGNISGEQVEKIAFPVESCLIVLGGAAQLIGMGGGANSSYSSGKKDESLDFASVQRDNPEMQRRCQEVINRCSWMEDKNPILSIHDVGAGGLSNAFPELIHDAGRGGTIQLRDVLVDDSEMSAAEIWCNESQERYVLAIDAKSLGVFQEICQRERCPYSVVGKADDSNQLVVNDALFEDAVVDMPLSDLLGNPPQYKRIEKRSNNKKQKLDFCSVDLHTLVHAVLAHPVVADKTFLITIGDRSVGGLVVQDQMVGPWQVPVSDYALTLRDYKGFAGEAMAIGERTPLAAIDSAASARIAVGECITNLLGAPIAKLGDIKLSANWMAAINHCSDSVALFDAVKAIGIELCPELGIAIPVGKDSMSMEQQWVEENVKKKVSSPVSLIISGFACVKDVRSYVGPQLVDDLESNLWLIDLGKKRLGCSVLAEVTGQLGDETPDLDTPSTLINLHSFINRLRSDGLLMSLHDRSDGGLIATVVEMAFAGNVGLEITLETEELVDTLFNEELGVVFQVAKNKQSVINELSKKYNLELLISNIGNISSDRNVVVSNRGTKVFEESLAVLRRSWSSVSFEMSVRRDNADCAKQQYDACCQLDNLGLSPTLTFDPNTVFNINTNALPKVAILREQGVNGQSEMAAAFHAAGFACVDAHMSDLLSGSKILQECVGLAVCGGFSYGDVLGAGQGWAKSILYNQKVLSEFELFFNRLTTFTFGACNGCQMLTQLKQIIPGADHWATFKRNQSEQFEARLSMVCIPPNPSVMMNGMVGSKIMIPIAHGEGRAQFDSETDLEKATQKQIITMQYVDYQGREAEEYPANPNGSELGITGLTTEDGRVLICMPHPERVFRSINYSWCPKEWNDQNASAPWLRLFQNARMFVS